jgi:hypothetical protein
LPGGNEETTKSLGELRSPGRDMNPGHPQYEAVVWYKLTSTRVLCKQSAHYFGMYCNLLLLHHLRRIFSNFHSWIYFAIIYKLVTHEYERKYSCTVFYIHAIPPQNIKCKYHWKQELQNQLQILIPINACFTVIYSEVYQERTETERPSIKFTSWLRFLEHLSLPCSHSRGRHLGSGGVI